MLYGGRFERPPGEAMAALSVSTHFDWALAPYDIAQSKAHARVLHRAGLLSDEESDRMQAGLTAIAGEVARGEFRPAPADEDVHTALERRLLEVLGAELGGKLRAGRSRNDQVATDFRMYLRDHARLLALLTLDLAEALREQAQRHADDPAPGFTHLQRAQPVSFGHELGKHVQALLRDVDRFRDWDDRAALSPMGAGALSGSSLPLDPAAVAAELGFSGVLGNSIDAVSDRDFVAEFLFVSAMLGVHLSRLGEEICLWASKEFAWAQLHDEFSTGSSIMPQKKNPDSAELARGKSGRLIGNLVAVLTALKGLPFAYNRDLQEDKEPAMDSIATLQLVLPAMAGTVATLSFDTDRMAAAAPEGFALATEIADWLVLRGVPFREAHEAAGACVRMAETEGCDLADLSAEDLAQAHPLLTHEVRDVLDVRRAIAARSTPSGTAPERVREQLLAAGAAVDEARSWARANPVAAALRP
jgi:argininosuccinate lyase